MRVVRELDSGGYDLFHYSGHVAVPFDTSYVGLRLHEDKLLDERVLRSLSNTGVPPIVFVNGCASADRLGNLCVSFMATGAKVVIGTRYEVAEDSARRFAERFYAALIGGAPAGAAVRLARQDLRRHADIDWASFVLYGDPSVLITAGQEPADEPAGKAAARLPDGRVGPDLQATALVDRLLRRAASSMVVYGEGRYTCAVHCVGRIGYPAGGALRRAPRPTADPVVRGKWLDGTTSARKTGAGRGIDRGGETHERCIEVGAPLVVTVGRLT